MAGQAAKPVSYNDWTTYSDAQTAMLAFNQQLAGARVGGGRTPASLTSTIADPTWLAAQQAYNTKFPGVIDSLRTAADHESGLQRFAGKAIPIAALALLAGGGNALAGGAGAGAGVGAGADAGIYSTEGVIGGGAPLSTGGAALGGAAAADTSAGISSTEGVLGGGTAIGGAGADTFAASGLGAGAGVSDTSAGISSTEGIFGGGGALGAGGGLAALGADTSAGISSPEGVTGGGASLGAGAGGAPVSDLSRPVGAAGSADTGGNGMGDFFKLMFGPGSSASSLFGGGAGSGGALSPLATLTNMGTGLYGLYQSEELRKQAKNASAAADPFGPYRAQYAQKLQDLEANPSNVSKLPGYQAGLDAVQRSMAAQGYGGSGNMMASLSKYGGDFFNQQIAQLMQLSGANATPGAGGSIGLQGSIAADQLAGSSLNRLGLNLATLGR